MPALVRKLGRRRRPILGAGPIGRGTPIAEPRVYADELFDYADGRLERPSLRVWIVQRLMLDQHLEHAAAAGIADAVLDRRFSGRSR